MLGSGLWRVSNYCPKATCLCGSAASEDGITTLIDPNTYTLLRSHVAFRDIGSLL
jgi:hypothetical protein